MLKLKVVISKVPIYSSTNVWTTVYNVTDVCVSDRGLKNILFPMFEEKKRLTAFACRTYIISLRILEGFS